MKKYLIVIEKSSTGFSAFSPDVPGCITVGKTIEETIENMKEAVSLYFETIVEEGERLPLGKGVQYHINNGLLKNNEIAEQYFLTEIDMHLPEVA